MGDATKAKPSLPSIASLIEAVSEQAQKRESARKLMAKLS
jgi:uncharacterized protein YjiS (DUF1127 family)